MKTRVPAAVGLALVLISVGTLVSCKKSKHQNRRNKARLLQPRPKRPRRPTPIATPTSVRSTSTPVGRWMPGSWATASPDRTTRLKYAQGQTIKHPLGYDIKIDTPMDFMGVTDHSEYVGVTKQANTPGSAT